MVSRLFDVKPFVNHVSIGHLRTAIKFESEFKTVLCRKSFDSMPVKFSGIILYIQNLCTRILHTGFNEICVTGLRQYERQMIVKNLRLHVNINDSLVASGLANKNFVKKIFLFECGNIRREFPSIKWKAARILWETSALVFICTLSVGFDELIRSGTPVRAPQPSQ